ncbi:hypothetical protein [Metabacillus niabensis]|uniref:hypothetical protein n=1 Tax=Metabacillus niabensis TaxID=324854 RepID=UPI0039A1FC43
MLGEIIEVIQFVIEIIKGNIPTIQLYVIIGILALTLIFEIFFEVKKGNSKNIIFLIGERLLLNAVGFIFYLSFYMFALKLLLKVWPALIPNIDTSIISWLGIISYITIILLIPLAFLFIKLTSLPLKIIIGIIHLALTAVLITVINSYWEPNINLPIPLLALNVIFNTLLSLVIVTYGADNKEIKNQKKSL